MPGFRRIGFSFGVAFLVLVSSAATLAAECGLKILFALDVSASVNDTEYELQLRGLADGFRDAAVLDAIRQTRGGLSAAVMEWSSPTEQAVIVPWRRLIDDPDALAFAEEIAAPRRRFAWGGTAIGSALGVARGILASDGLSCRRTVIDVSGDGISNMGHDTAKAADLLDAAGVTINGLAVLVDEIESDIGLVDYYLLHVVRGPLAFVEVAETFEDFPEAMRRKLLREIRPDFVALAPR